jgi:hypothetical protein
MLYVLLLLSLLSSLAVTDPVLPSHRPRAERPSTRAPAETSNHLRPSTPYRLLFSLLCSTAYRSFEKRLPIFRRTHPYSPFFLSIGCFRFTFLSFFLSFSLPRFALAHIQRVFVHRCRLVSERGKLPPLELMKLSLPSIPPNLAQSDRHAVFGPATTTTRTSALQGGPSRASSFPPFASPTSTLPPSTTLSTMVETA